MKHKRRFIRFVGWTALFCFMLAAAGVITTHAIYSDYEKRAAQFDLSKIGEVSQRSAVYDINGELYSYLHGENRLVVPFEKISGWFVDALLAREDSRFWEHDGVDYIGIARAMVTNLRSGDVKQGGSTLTQQLARNALDLNTKSYDRKALEAALARRIERTLSKKQILEMYANRIYFGSGFHGIETAARGYFGKSAAELDLGESAVLAGLIKSPNRLSPRNDFDAALAERNSVLDRMVELNKITPAQAGAAKATRITLNKNRGLRFQDDYVMDGVGRELERLLDPGVVEFGGLRIFTTIDPQLQRLAQEAADRQLTKIEEARNFPHPRKSQYEPAAEGQPENPTDYLQAAVVAVDNRTGAIRAIVGGRDYSQSKYSRALLSQRQIGSTFKPFVYAAAFQRGLLPGSLVSDEKIGPNEFRNVANNWSPENSDGGSLGLQPAAVGLIKSRNTMSVRVGEFAGLPTIHDLANQLGIGSSMPDLPVSFLGAFETTLKDLTGAYTIFPNSGVFRPPYLISRVEDENGNIIYRMQEGEKRVLQADTAWIVSSILQAVMKTGTAAKSAQLGWQKPAAGKTGTTNDFHDAWFVGYTSSLTCGVWVGLDQPQTIMEKGYGSALALPIWVDFMNQVPEKTYPAANFEAPFEVVKVRICSGSGARATTQCEKLHLAYDAMLPAQRVPGQTCPLHPEPPPTYAAQVPAVAGTPQYAYATPADTQTRVASPTPQPQPPEVPAVTSESPAQPTVRDGSSDAIAAAGTRPPSLQIEFNASVRDTVGSPSARPAAPAATPVPRGPRVERTSKGLRIYPENEPAPQTMERRAAEAPQTVERRATEAPVRVMRAVPVDPTLKRAEEDRQTEDSETVRVYRAKPVERESNKPLRIFPLFRDHDD